MSMMELIYLTLATFRLSKMITREDGFMNIFSRLRNYLGRNATIQDEYQPVRQSLAELFNCPYCLGVWIAGFLYLFRKPLLPVIKIFTIAGLQSLFQGLDDKLRG